MKLKSYFSGTVEAALDLARQELGDDALLVNARPATPETRYLGAYEVVFGVPPAKQSAASLTAAPAAPADAAGNDRLAEEVASLKRDFERMMRSLAVAQPPALAAAPPQEDLLPTADYTVDATLGRAGTARTIVTLVGPPGVGKTTTLVKLAARYGLTAHKPVRILSTDVFRIAAADQLQSLAAILGIGCDIAETAGALAQLLEEHRGKELLFLDTPGLARADMEDAADLAALIAAHPEADTHLVLPAFMRPADMERAIQQFAAFAPRKLLFTRIDETSSLADIVAVAGRARLPISFLGTGQQIPDDLEPAERSRLDALLEQEALPGKIRAMTIQTKGAAA